MNHKPRANCTYRYAWNRSSPGSVADAFNQFEDSIKAPPNLGELNEIGYRSFCSLAHDTNYRRTIYSRSGTRYV